MNIIRFGIVGTNFISDWFIKGASEDKRFVAAAVCSRQQETADAFAAKHNIPHTFTSLEAMASSPLIDAVYVATPNFVHALQSILCMKYGKHVLCEKPLASNAREAKAMIEASKKYDVTLMEAMKPTLTPNFRCVIDNLPRVGVVRRYFASYCQYSSRYDAFKAGNIMNAFRPELSNGAIMDIGVYTIYPMVVLFGRPNKIDASGIVLHSGADAQGSINFTFDRMNASVLYSKIADSHLPTEIQGESGNLLLDRINTISRVQFIPRLPAVRGGNKEIAAPIDITAATNHDEYFYEASEFIDLVIDGRKESIVNSHNNSLITMEIIDEVRRQLGVVFPADNA